MPLLPWTFSSSIWKVCKIEREGMKAIFGSQSTGWADWELTHMPLRLILSAKGEEIKIKGLCHVMFGFVIARYFTGIFRRCI